MPFVLRDGTGRIVAAFANLQPGQDVEHVEDDDPDYLRLMEQSPVAPGDLKPLTFNEIKSMREERTRIDREAADIRKCTEQFNYLFSELETGLSALLYVIINRTDSQ